MASKLRCSLLASLALASALHSPPPAAPSGRSRQPALERGAPATADVLRRVARPWTMTLKGAGAAVAAVDPYARASTSADVLETTIYFALWYWGNTYYNIYNKRTMNLLGGSKGGLAVSASAAQLGIGMVWVLTLWLLGLRTAPRMTASDWQEMAPVGLWVACAHAASVIALGATAVSFAQIIKSSEPIFVAVTEIVVHQRWEPWQVYATLPLIVCGVVLASVKDFSFSFNSLSFGAAMFANLCAALKAVRVKDLMGLPWVQDMGPSNMYAIIHIISVLWILPAAFVTEGPTLRRSYKRCLKKGAPPEQIINNLVLSGSFFYMYQEMSILCLSKVKPMTHSVANTVKRIISLLISLFIFRSPISNESIIGSAFALGGSILYLKALKSYGTYQSLPRFI